MQTEDTLDGQPPVSQPSLDDRTAGTWTSELQTANSSNGYGRPDPDEFGLAPLDPPTSETDLTPDGIPHDPTPTDRTETQREIVETSSLETGQVAGLETLPLDAAPEHGSWSADGPKPDHDPEPQSGSRAPERGEITEHAGVDLWTHIGSRDRLAEPDLAQTDPSDQPASAPSKSPLNDANTSSRQTDEPGSRTPDRAPERALEAESVEPPNGHHSFETGQNSPVQSPSETVGSIHQRVRDDRVDAPDEEVDAIDDALRLPTPTRQLGADGDNSNSSSAAPGSRARSAKTEKQYDGWVRRIWRNSVEARSTDPQQPAVVTPLEVTQDFIASRALGSENTWNLCRAALLWHLAQHRNENDSYEQGYRLLSDSKSNTAPGAKTRKAPKKTISEDHLNRVIDTLGAMNRHVNWGSRTQFWLQAGMASGVRPGEWLGASWLDETQTILCIPNSKRKTTVPIYSIVSPGQTIHDVEVDNPERLTPGASSDENKRIRNVEIDPKDRIWVNLHMVTLNAYLDKVPEDEREDRFVTYYNGCRKVLHTACVRAFNGKKQYPLYCMRSQYAANMKAAMPLEDVSARMGHQEGGRTTMSSYGPMSAAHGRHGELSPIEQDAKAEAQKARDADARSASAAGAPVHRPPTESE